MPSLPDPTVGGILACNASGPLADITLLVCSTSRGLVRCNRIVPKAQTRKNMRRHVQGVRRCRGNLRISPRRRQPSRRKLSAVIGMNQVMRGTRMLGLTAIDRLQDLCCQFLVGVRSVRR